MKITQLLYTLCVIGSCFLVKAHATVVNYYTSVGSFVSNNDIPQGNFVEGLSFSASMSIKINGWTQVKVIYATDCHYGVHDATYGIWHRYFIVPKQVTDVSGKITMTLDTSSAAFALDSNNYAYEFDTTEGAVHSCTVGSLSLQEILEGNSTLQFRATLNAVSGQSVSAGNYLFQVPVKALAVLGGGSSWYSAALSESAPNNTTAYFNAKMTNFCSLNKVKYDFDFGTLTEGAVNESGFQLQSDIKELDIDCIEPTNITLSVVTANNEGGNPNKVKMGNDLVADFFINNALQNSTTFTATNNIHIPLHANLRKNINSIGQVQAGQYTGASIIKIIFH